MNKDYKNIQEIKEQEISSTSNLRPDTANSNYIFPFEKLDVWQLAVDLADYVLELVNKIPHNKHIRLVSQMEAAVTSVSQNIAEGKGRQYKKEFIQYLSIAQGSLYEMITLNEVFRKRKLFSEEEAQKVREKGIDIDRKLNGLMNSLKGIKRKSEHIW